jgi:hypothetical protein
VRTPRAKSTNQVREDRRKQTDEVAATLLDAEREARQEKTAKLRALRLAKETVESTKRSK